MGIPKRRMMRQIIAVMVMWLTCVSSAHAEREQSAFHPAAVRQGFYTGLSTGRTIFTGLDRSLYKDGWVVGFKLGYDIWSYLGAEFVFKLSGHPSTLGTISLSIPKSFFVYQYLTQLKGNYPITQRLHLELGVGGGFFISSPNLNALTNGSRAMFYGEFGLQYFMRTRGISVGLDPSVAGVQNLKGAVIQLTGFVRYTF
jgi:hypothetical protein